MLFDDEYPGWEDRTCGECRYLTAPNTAPNTVGTCRKGPMKPLVMPRVEQRFVAGRAIEAMTAGVEYYYPQACNKTMACAKFRPRKTEASAEQKLTN